MSSAPHGGHLVHRGVETGTARENDAWLTELPRIRVAEATARDIENIANGAFSPLEGFQGSASLESVLRDLRLPDGTIWPLPQVLPLTVPAGAARPTVEEGTEVVLESESGTLALLEVAEVFRFDPAVIAQRTYGTLDPTHPGVAPTLGDSGWYAGGRITLLDAAPARFPAHTLSPGATRELISNRGWSTVTGFQTRNVPHLAHEHLQKVALNLTDGLLIQPLVGWKKPGDFEDAAILAAYEALVANYLPEQRVALVTLQTAMRYAGPREAVFHALVRKNYGCTHFIVGRDHAGVGSFYGPYDAQRIFDRFPPGELGIEILRLSESFICRRCGGPQTDRTCPHAESERLTISGTRFRQILQGDPGTGTSPEAALVRPEVLEALRKVPRLFVPG